MNRHLIVLLAAFLWLVACSLIGDRLREKSPDGHSYPTYWSWLLKWIAPLGAIIIMGTDLTLTVLAGKH
jgi:hypothetical protein